MNNDIYYNIDKLNLDFIDILTEDELSIHKYKKMLIEMQFSTKKLIKNLNKAIKNRQKNNDLDNASKLKEILNNIQSIDDEIKAETNEVSYTKVFKIYMKMFIALLKCQRNNTKFYKSLFKIGMGTMAVIGASKIIFNFTLTLSLMNAFMVALAGLGIYRFVRLYKDGFKTLLDEILNTINDLINVTNESFIELYSDTITAEKKKSIELKLKNAETDIIKIQENIKKANNVMKK